MFREVIRNRQYRELIIEMTKRDIIARYKGSYLGILWSFVTPVLMLIIYTYVFSVIFKTKWSMEEQSYMSFGLTLFAGMIVYNIFSEVMIKSTTIIISNTNYVKKVIFPLEIYPAVIFLSSFIHALISVFTLLIFLLISGGSLSLYILLLPIVIIPLMLLSIGIGWIFSALGVFVRDLSYIINIIAQMLMFLSPVFYPVEVVPVEFRNLYYWNPLTTLIEQFRKILLWAEMPDWIQWFKVLGVSIIVYIIGYYIFRKCKGAFADVL